MISSFYYYFHSRSSFFLSCQSKWKHIDHGNQGLNYVVADRLNSRARVTRRLHTKNEQFQMGKEKRIVTQSKTDERLNSLVTIDAVSVVVDIVTGLFSTLILSHSFIFVPFIYFVYFVFTNFYCVSSRSPIYVWDLHRVVLHRRIHRRRRHSPLLPMMMMRMMLQLLVLCRALVLPCQALPVALAFPWTDTGSRSFCGISPWTEVHRAANCWWMTMPSIRWAISTVWSAVWRVMLSQRTPGTRSMHILPSERNWEMVRPMYLVPKRLYVFEPLTAVCIPNRWMDILET